MSVLKIIGLGLLLLLAFPVSLGNNAWAALATIILIVGSILMYLVPTIVAVARDHPNKTSIVVLNIFLGWTVLGWVAALVWAYSAKAHDVVVRGVSAVPQPVVNTSSPPSAQDDFLGRTLAAKRGEPYVARGGPPAAVPSPAPRSSRQCPFCAEEILAAAIKCKHCGSSVEAVQPIVPTPSKHGACPNCSARIPVDSKACTGCGAEFGEGSSWSVVPG